MSSPAGSYTRHISEECYSCRDSGLSPLKRVVSDITSARARSCWVLTYTYLWANLTSLRLHITAIFTWQGVMFLIFNVLKLSLASYTKPNLVILYFYSIFYELYWNSSLQMWSTCIVVKWCILTSTNCCYFKVWGCDWFEILGHWVGTRFIICQVFVSKCPDVNLS